jgi:hypothetical protein
MLMPTALVIAGKLGLFILQFLYLTSLTICADSKSNYIGLIARSTIIN